MLEQLPAAAGDLQPANRPLDAAGAGVGPLGPIGLKVVAAQDGQQPVERPVVEVELQQPDQGPQGRRAIERLARLDGHGDAQLAEDLVDQLGDRFERAEDDGDFARPGVAVGQQPLDRAGDHLDFAQLAGGGEDFDAESGGRGQGSGDVDSISVLGLGSSVFSHPVPLPSPLSPRIGKQRSLHMRHGRPRRIGRPVQFLDRCARMPTAKLVQRFQRLGEEVGPARLGLQRQRDEHLLRAGGKNLKDFVLRAGEVGEAVGDDETRRQGEKERRRELGFDICAISVILSLSLISLSPCLLISLSPSPSLRPLPSPACRVPTRTPLPRRTGRARGAAC